jgi:hypothetical protein
MTKDKAQKRAIRERMAKTGERYATARHFELELHRSPPFNADLTRSVQAGEPTAGTTPALLPFSMQAVTGVAADAAMPARIAEPGVSDAAVERATGRDWDAWLTLLDEWGANQKTHAEIARHVADAYGIDAWWAQSVTVGYERMRGMRAVHERPDGFSVSASKTFPVPVERLFAALTEEAERARWLNDLQLRQRTSNPFSSARFDVLPGDSRLNVTFIARGPDKSVAQLQQERLASVEDVEPWRAVWKGHLAALARYLASDDGSGN